MESTGSSSRKDEIAIATNPRRSYRLYYRSLTAIVAYCLVFLGLYQLLRINVQTRQRNALTPQKQYIDTSEINTSYLNSTRIDKYSVG
jgi:hypothetical protein